MQRTATLVATLSEPPSEGVLRSLPEEVAWLEVRDDLAGDIDVDWLRDRFPGRLLYTLRSRAEGGRGPNGGESRHRRLMASSSRFDLVDLEAERDLVPPVLDSIDSDRRVLSWHGPCLPLARLRSRFEAMADTPARLYKLVPAAGQSGEELEPLKLLHHLRRDDVIAFAAGAIGAWTRQIAPYLGAGIVYGAVSSAAAPGQPTVEWLVEDAGLPSLRPVEVLVGLVGNPVAHSLSARIHNRMYRELPLAFLYVPFHVERFGDFWLEVVESGTLDEMGFPLRGLSVTTPHKGAALAVAGAVSPLAERVGAVNTLVQREGVWEGENTDCEGIMRPLEALGVTVDGRLTAVVGSGRAGRAAAFALSLSGAQVTLYNRSEERGREAARELELPFAPLAELEPSRYELIVQATSLGRDESEPLPFEPEALDAEAVLVDLVYGDRPTRLATVSRQRGLRVVDGLDVLLAQAIPQFRLMTNREMSSATVRAALGMEVA